MTRIWKLQLRKFKAHYNKGKDNWKMAFGLFGGASCWMNRGIYPGGVIAVPWQFQAIISLYCPLIVSTFSGYPSSISPHVFNLLSSISLKYVFLIQVASMICKFEITLRWPFTTNIHNGNLHHQSSYLDNWTSEITRCHRRSTRVHFHASRRLGVWTTILMCKTHDRSSFDVTDVASSITCWARVYWWLVWVIFGVRKTLPTLHFPFKNII